MTTIPTDVANTDTGALTVDSAADAFLAQFEDNDASKKKPSEEQNEEVEETSPQETDTEETEVDPNASEETLEDEGAIENDADAEGDAEPEKKYVDSDDAIAKVTVDGVEHEVPIKDLKRLYGQETALTRKSQEVAELRKVADQKVATNVAALDVLLKRAQEKAALYTNIDWMGLAKNPDISAEEASALRTEAQHAHEEVQFLQQGLDGFMGAIEQEQKEAAVKQAKVCVQALSTPGTDDKPNPLHIEGWNDQTYNDIRQFAVDLGAAQAEINKLVDPVAFKVLHMAMLYKRGASKVMTKKVDKQPKKIVKTTSNAAVTRKAVAPNKNKAMDRLQREGSVDAAANAFLAGFEDE